MKRAFANLPLHGGKDGHPFPVERKIYDRSINILHEGIKQARLGRREKIEAIRSLRGFLR